MKNIYFRNGVLIYYGNPAGYLSDGKVILDSIFDKGEIKEFLSEKEKLAVEVREGVYDRLSVGGGMEEVKILCRERLSPGLEIILPVHYLRKLKIRKSMNF